MNKFQIKQLYAALGLWLALLLCSCAPVRARAEAAFLFDPALGPQPHSVAVLGDTLYVMGSDGLYAYAAATGETTCLMPLSEWPVPETLEEDTPFADDRQLFGGDSLMILDQPNRKIWEYTPNGLEVALDYAGTALDDPLRQYGQPVYRDGRLFVRCTWRDGRSVQALLYRVDLADGRFDVLAVPGVLSLTAYREGELLAAQWTDAEGHQLVVIDAQTGVVKERLAAFPNPGDGGIAYSQAEDRVYGWVDGALCTWDGGGWRTVRHGVLPARPYAFGILGNHYLAASFDGISLFSLSGEEQATVLTVRGMMPTMDLDRDFSMENPGVVVSRAKEAHFCAEEVYKAILSGETTDLFLIPLNAGALRLMDKGYLEPLTGSAAILEDCRQLAPAIGQPLLRDGAPYAVASEIRIDAWLMRTDWEVTPPATIRELLQGHIAWEDDARFDGTPWIATAYGSRAWNVEDYLRYLLSQFLMEQENQPQPARFSTDAMRALLSQIQRAAFPEPSNAGNGADKAASGVFSAQYILSLGGDAYQSARLIPPPALEQDGAARVPARLHVYVLNPLSRNKEAALAYLEYLASHRSPAAQALLSPDTAQPTLVTSCFNQLNELRKEEERNRVVLGMVQPQERLALEERQTQLAAEIALLEGAPSSWLVYQPALEDYRALIAPRLSLQLHPLLEDPYARHASVYGDMLDILLACAQGSVSLEQCVDKLDALAARVYAEQ